MSSPHALTKDPSVEICGRLSILENQHRSMIEYQAETLAEIRSLREDLLNFKSAISKELIHVYGAVTKNSG